MIRAKFPLLAQFFDAGWYAERYPDVAKSGVAPFEHFILYGAREGRSPGPGFDAAWYLERYPDVAEEGENPLLHYLDTAWRKGARGGR